MENFVVVKKDLHREDLRVLTSQIREQESLVRLKRRWLMDLPLSTREQKKIDEILPSNDKILPESFLREDDVSYEDVKTCIETAFGVRNCGKEPHSVHEDICGTDSRDGLQEIFFLLDAMTNKGLYSIAKILTEGVIKFDKTNWSMKRRIKELLPDVIAIKNDVSKTKMRQLFQLLQDPNSFRGNQMVLTTASTAYFAAAIKVLDGLEDFPAKALSAMHRKLRGVRGYIPSTKPSKSGMMRDKVIRVVKKRCMKMLSKLSEVDEPSEQLSGALGVAGLTLKLMMDRPAVRDFRRFSPEIEALQNDIVKAIHLLNEAKTVSLIELKKVQNLLDPNFELSIRSLRTAIRNLLIEYLYECSDMDKIPDCIVETLDIINRRSQLRPRKTRSTSETHLSPHKLMKELMEKEVECVLTISAQAKEVISNLLLKHDFDEEFPHAYMEDYELTDTLGFSDDDEQVRDISQHFEFHSYNLHVEESFGEANPKDSNSPVSTSKRDGCYLLSPIGRSHVTQYNSDKTNGFLYSPSFSRCSGELGIAYSDSVKPTTKQKISYQSHSPARSSCHNDLKIEETTSGSPAAPKYVEETDFCSQQSRSLNQYLEVQEACDATSMITYRFVGLVLDKLAKTNGLVLYRGDRSYLHNYASIPEDSEEHHDALLASKFAEMWNNVFQQTAGLPQYGQLGHGSNNEYNTKDSSVKLVYEAQPRPRAIASLAGETIVNVACGTNHTVTVTKGGHVYTWGFGGYGRLGHREQKDERAPRIVDVFTRHNVLPPGAVVSAGSANSSCTAGGGQLYMWGKIKVSGDDWMYPKPLMDLSGWNLRSMDSGNMHHFVGADSSCISWGHAQSGELGYGPHGQKSSAIPKKVDLLEGMHVINVACGFAHSLVVVDRTNIADRLEQLEVDDGKVA